MSEIANQLSPRDRYMRDAAFHRLVEMMRVELQRGAYTPTELREAVILAATIETERSMPRRFYEGPSQ